MVIKWLSDYFCWIFGQSEMSCIFIFEPLQTMDTLCGEQPIWEKVLSQNNIFVPHQENA